MDGTRAAKLRRLSLALGTSIGAMCAITASPAQAQCAPDPTSAGGVTNCSGTDADGLVVATDNSTITMDPDAIVRAGPSNAAFYVTGNQAILRLDGTVDGEGNPGVALIAGPRTMVPCDPNAGASVGNCTPGTTVINDPSIFAAIDIAVGAVATGSSALYMDADPTNLTGGAIVDLTNAGTMTGTAGPAIDGARARLTITNLASGSIGDISAQEIRLTNAGTVGNLSGVVSQLYNQGTVAGIVGAVGTVTNDGLIDGGTGIAIDDTGSGLAIYNSGSIISTGAGPTIRSTGGMTLFNYAGALVGGASTAIEVGGALQLTNEGTIAGSVISNAVVGSNSFVDTRLGTISGDLILGAGDDALRAAYDPGTGAVSSITGAIDGGAGIDTITFEIAADATLGGVALPFNFERLGLELTNAAFVTLAPAFAASGGVTLSGTGSVLNQADQTTIGAAVSSFGLSYVDFTNAADIAASLSAGEYAVDVGADLINLGTITGNGGSGAQSFRSLTNSGTISATEIGASTFGMLDNSGTVVSTAGIGAQILYAGLIDSSNSGSISGALTGLDLTDSRLTNTGIISGGTTGVSLTLNSTFINAAGGTVDGGTYGILGTGFTVSVANAGTINGDVQLAWGNDVFYDAGGTVNGAILLGDGDDQLVVDLATTSGGLLAGATGGVDAGLGLDSIHYLVNADASANLALPNSFEAFAFELDNYATLALTAPAMLNSSIGLSGNGTVTFAGMLSAVDLSAVDGTAPTFAQLALGQAGPARDLTFVNDGTVSLTVTQTSFSQGRAAIYGITDVTNNGAIAVTTTSGVLTPGWGIFGGDSAVNNGSISLSGTGGWGIYTTRDVLNTGSISDTPGTGASGVLASGSLDNRGTIRVDGVAVEGAHMVTNSGIIESRLGTAIQLAPRAVLINEAGGSVTGSLAANLDSGLAIVNRGAIVGDVSSYAYSFGASAYIAEGGTLTGDLTFGAASDVFVYDGANTGVSGTIDGGDGTDFLGYRLASSGSVSLDGSSQFVNFEDALVQAVGAGTIATVAAANPFAGNLYVVGDGKVINTAALGGQVSTYLPIIPDAGLNPYNLALASFENQGSIATGATGDFAAFANSGVIAGVPDTSTVYVSTAGPLAFANSGMIAGLVQLNADLDLTLDNSGSITSNGTFGLPALLVGTNSGSPGGATAIVNSGTITVGASSDTATSAILIQRDPSGAAAITNSASGMVTGGVAGYGILSASTGLVIDNSGTISGDSATQGAAIGSFGSNANVIRNTGTISGRIFLGSADDRTENSGTLTGPVILGGGNDTFVLRAAGTLGGIVDGGTGTNAFIVDATGSGSLAGSQLGNFSTLTQIGSDAFTYAGAFAVPTIALEGGRLVVAAGQSLSTAGATAITGGAAGVGIANAGVIAGAITLGSGADSVVNSGTISGFVDLGSGDDSFIEGVGSTAGGVDGGLGSDIYGVRLAGDRTGMAARSNFEQLAIEGAGTLTLTLDQDYQSVALVGTGLNASLAGYTIGRIDGSAGNEQVFLDGDIAAIALGSGDDTLTFSTANLAGFYDGGAGIDALAVNGTAPVTLTGTTVGFESVALTGSALTVAGTLGRAGETLGFDSGAQSLTIASGATLAGIVDLGGGDDGFRLASGGVLAGTVLGGAGDDTATVDATSAVTLANGSLVGFEQFVAQGGAQLTFGSGDFAFAATSIEGDLTIAPGASLATQMLTFGPADNTLTLAGGFTGSVNGGAGSDAIAIAGGSAASPVAFGSITEVEALRMNAGLATIGSSATFSNITLTGGRLIGVAGSTITAPTISVGPGATFGSAGIVNGNISVAGTLSPGASPGVMTVNGNVSLGASSVSLFEITPTAVDKLVVNGTVAIAQGATAQIVADQSLVPGQSLDLVVASGGITGSYTNVVKPTALFGYLVQDATTITLRGQFLNDVSYAPQVQGSIAYLNSVLTSGQSSAALLAAVPQLVNAAGVADQAALAQLTPEAYASATQITYETGLALAQVGRGSAFAASGDEPRAFTFASGLAGTRTLKAGNGGAARAEIDSYGVLGGIGWGSTDFSVGAFVGYSNGTQDLDDRGARTKVDGIVAGLHSRWSGGGFGFKATIAYDGGRAKTDRTVPDGSASGSYDLTGWIADVSADYRVAVGAAWEVRPTVGVTAISANRDALTESSTSAFRLDVAKRRDNATFVDGGITLAGGQNAGARLRPLLSLGVRHQVDGRTPNAIAALGGGGFGLGGTGVSRARTVVTASLGADANLTERLAVFAAVSGERGEGESNARANAGLRLQF